MIMRTMRIIGRAVLGLAVAALMAVVPARAADTVTIGTVGSPSANLWPLFIGLDKGFFAAESIKPDLIYVPASAAVIQQLAAGSLDMTMSTGLVDPIRAIDQGAAIALTRFEVQAPPYAGLSGFLCEAFPSCAHEALFEHDGELRLRLGPLSRRSFPIRNGVVQNQI